VVSVAGGGAATTGPTGTTATAEGAGTKSSTSKAAKATIKAPAKSQLPPAKVKIGSPGHGKGYKNGHFTGEFFGEEEEK